MLKGKIRPINISDAEMILTWRNQDHIRINMYNNSIIQLEEHMKWFNKIINDDSCVYFIYEQNKEPLGLLSFSEIDKKNNKATWAFYSAYQDKVGVGIEMEKLALDYAFNRLNVNKLYCEVLDFNYTVVNLHRKFGFKIEGVRKQDYCREGKYYDIYQLAMFRDEYLKEQNNSAKNPKLRKSAIISLESLSMKYPELYKKLKLTQGNSLFQSLLTAGINQISLDTMLDSVGNFNIKRQNWIFYESINPIILDYLEIRSYLKMNIASNVIIEIKVVNEENKSLAVGEVEVDIL